MGSRLAATDYLQLFLPVLRFDTALYYTNYIHSGIE
jgi:hypothetical protein